MPKDRSEYHAEYYKRRKALRAISNDQPDPPKPKIKRVKPIVDQPTTPPKPVENYITQPAPDEPLTEINMVNVRKIAQTTFLIVFLVANTAFLVNEQARFYTLKGDTKFYAFGVSLLSEAAVILLSFFYAQTRDIFRRIKIGIVLALTVATIVSIICLGVEKKQSHEEKNAEISTLLREEIHTLKEASPMSPKGNLKLEKKEEELRRFLQSNSIASLSGVETFTLVMLRLLSLSWNVIFATLIAFVFSEKYAK